jgi:hypothetical protein
LPHEGHLEALHNAQIIFNPSYLTIDMTVFKECNWKHFYGNVHEAILPNAPPPRGKDIDLRMFVNSNHASDNLMQRLGTGFLIYLNMAPIMWHSKKSHLLEGSD